MYIKGGQFDFLFTDYVFDERVNLFVGPNASGKTITLRAINGFFSLAEEEALESYDLHSQTQIALFASEDWPRDGSNQDLVKWYEAPLLYIPATRINLPNMRLFSGTIDHATTTPTDNPLEELFDTVSGVFNGQYIEQAVDWVVHRKYDRFNIMPDRDKRWERLVNDPAMRRQFHKALEVGHSCAKGICPEVMKGNAPQNFTEFTNSTVHYGMGVSVNEEIFAEPQYLGALSSGTQGTLLWIYALALKMAYHYEWQEGWEEKPAILLIDEIENHLHPTWQRRVIPALLEHFPKLQIFATTHSPFVVAGLKAGQVHLLKRDENGRVTATTNDKDIIGWTMDEILRTMMGVDDPTDDATAAAARELRQLRNEWPRSSPEEEQKRQERITELRQKVDRDLLAGGPWKRRREEFAERFQAALEKHGLPLNLGQENG